MKKTINKKDNKAITLIALVITIIVLLILAGITVAGLSGNNLFENTKLAKENYQKSKELEDETLADYEDAITGDRGNKINYSTEEQVVGTWLNNVPLYRKTIIIENANASWSAIDLSNTFASTLDTIQLMDFLVKRWYNKTNNDYYLFGYNFMNPSNNTDKVELLVSLDRISTSANYKKPLCYFSAYTGSPMDLYLTVQYTKNVE